MRKCEELHQPLNSQERYLHAIAIRQDILIEQVNSIIEHLAKKDSVAVTNHESINSVTTSKSSTTTVAKAEEKPAPKRRTTRKTSVKAEVEVKAKE